MDRRSFLTTAGAATAATAATTVSAPAIAQSQPEIQWRLQSAFPKSLATLYGATEFFAKRVADMTDNKFQIRTFAAGEIVPGPQVLDAVQNGTVEMGQSPSYYFIGKEMALAFDTAIPFGLNSRQHRAWMIHGGGLELMRELHRDFNIHQIPAGNTGAQMGGWFRNEIKSLEDVKGLKFRIAGLGGQVFAKLGAVPTQIAPADIYPALEKGSIDAVEFVGPYDDERLGFHKVAKFYYYPGFWEGSAQLNNYINIPKWQSLPKVYQAILEAASAETYDWMLAKYDFENATALKRLVAAGAQLRPFPRDLMIAAYKVTFEIYDGLAASNPKFKKVYDAFRPFRDDQYLWFRVAENPFENFVYSQSAQR